MRKGLTAAGVAAAATVLSTLVVAPSAGAAPGRGSIKVCVDGNDRKSVGVELSRVRGQGHKNGTIRDCRTWGDLRPGRWWVDVDVPRGYQIGDDNVAVTVRAGERKTVRFVMHN